MSIKKSLDSLNLIPPKEEMKELRDESKRIVLLLKEEIKKAKLDADVFVGGSFAKGTLVKGEFYDVDIFVRFDWEYEKLSEPLNKILESIARKNKLKLEKLHGSRDYFRIIMRDKFIFEIVPVTRIKKQKEARNVTDLSYFHVNYVKRALGKNLAKEVIFAKQFCKGQKVYGAESYVNGFSGYALECLIIYYKSFEKMLKELSKIEIGGRIIIDPAGHYKKKEDVLFEMNESKLGSPIILVDPTWKERNATAALSREAFEKFQESARKFLKSPSNEFFEVKKFDLNKFKNKAGKGEEFLNIQLETNKQKGDIAGTKLRKFSNYLEREISRYFEVKASEFEYSGESNASLYLIVKPKSDILRIGPPIKLEKHAKAFKKANKNSFEKNGVLYSKIKVNFSAKKFVRDFADKYKKTLEGMDVTKMEIEG